MTASWKLTLLLISAPAVTGCGSNPFSSIKPGLNPGAVAAVEQIEQLAAEGKIEEALAKSSMALMLVENGVNPDQEFLADIRVNHGRLLHRNNRYDDAINQFDLAIAAYGKLKEKEGKIAIATAASADSLF